MRILMWHVHGSWTTSFVSGGHEVLLPVLPDRGPDGQGRARTWSWPQTAQEITPDDLRDADIDLVVLQRPHEIELAHRWTGRRPGTELPAVYVEHDTPRETASATRHPVADRDDITLVHVTHFNHVMWDNGTAPTTVIEHGVADPGDRYTGADPSAAVVVNHPVRRGRLVGADLMIDLARHLPVHVYGMGMSELTGHAAFPVARLHDDLPQSRMHQQLAHHRMYFHPYRWTSLGLALLEAMALGLPVLGLSTTEGPRAVPPEAGLLSNSMAEIRTRARHWLDDPAAARAAGAHARKHVLEHYSLPQFHDRWNCLLNRIT
ncbi:glycosyltransferase [Cumulibacter manganitolerans]|uniref:glycosyltransferase n=1 Tax=Cumulibacter manganitolerans TaxID=1884992 RepID=UPI0012978D9F|nr:glycosyltransferase [Cumulibacter manganitolerans]